MADTNDLPKLKFCGLERKYAMGKDVSFDIIMLSYKSSFNDVVVLCGYNEEEEERDLTRRSVTEAMCDHEEDRAYFVFTACDFKPFSESKFKFKYLSADSIVVAESCPFEVEPYSISEESFLTVDATDSFFNSTQLLKKVSGDSTGRIEEESKKLQAELKSMIRKAEDYETCCKMLKMEKNRILREYEEEKHQREQDEAKVKELEGCLADKMQYIDAQNRQIEELERNVKMKAQLHNALREDFDGQALSSEECLIENELLRNKLVEYRKDYARLTKLSEEEREFYKKEFSQYESEIAQLKQLNQRKVDEIESKLAEALSTVKEVEEKFVAEKRRTAGLEAQLQDTRKEFDEQYDLKEFEFAEVKKQLEEMQEILDAEREANDKATADYESTIDELENKLNSDSKKVDFLTTKCESMQSRAIEAEEKVEELTLRLEEADKKMMDMENLIKSSKSELEILKKTVSAPEASVEKKEAGSRKSSKDKTTPKSLSRLSSKSTEYPVSESKLTWNREKEQGLASSPSKSRSSTAKIVYSYSESKRGASRYSTRRKSSFQEDSYFEKEKSKPFQRPEKQTGLLRQHRNALLRENSRLRYTMTMLNHDCAILNYTLQQVVTEAEQKLESLYSLYARKESECAAYESMLAPNTLTYDPHSGMSGEQVETYFPDGSCIQNAMVPVSYGYYGEPYYDAYRPQDIIMQPPAILDQAQYQQLQYAPQVYVPTQQMFCAEPYPQVQHEVATVQT